MNAQLHHINATHPEATVLETEQQALAVAQELAQRFAATASERDSERLLPFAEMDALAQSGLLAITVPEEYGGLDVSNATLAEITATLAQADGSIG